MLRRRGPGLQDEGVDEVVACSEVASEANVEREAQWKADTATVPRKVLMGLRLVETGTGIRQRESGSMGNRRVKYDRQLRPGCSGRRRDI